jgi:benzylsuccinate CoA-transferase BbsF subunit
MHFLGPALLDFIANGSVQTPEGNRDREFAPHGVYPCAGEDSWIAIVCTSDQQWQALAGLMDGSQSAGAGATALVNDARFATLSQRLENHDTIDQVIANWTRAFDAAEVQSMLLARGIAASKGATSDDLGRDPQFSGRGHFVEVGNDKIGRAVVERSSYILSRTPARIVRPAPALGADTDYVLESILGYNRARIEQLRTGSVLE